MAREMPPQTWRYWKQDMGVFRMADYRGARTKKDSQREMLQAQMSNLTNGVMNLQKKILSPEMVLSADNNEIVRLKDQIESDDRELQKLKRKLIRLDDFGR